MQRNEWIFFQFGYARVPLSFGMVNNIHSCLLHLIGCFILRYILKFSISNPMNYEFGSSMSFAKTMQKTKYYKVLPCFLLSLSE